MFEEEIEHIKREIEGLKQEIQYLKIQVGVSSDETLQKTREEDEIADACEKIGEPVRPKSSGIIDVFRTNRYLQKKAKKVEFKKPAIPSSLNSRWALIHNQYTNRIKVVKLKK